MNQSSYARAMAQQLRTMALEPRCAQRSEYMNKAREWQWLAWSEHAAAQVFRTAYIAADRAIQELEP